MGLDALVDQIEELSAERRQIDAQIGEAYRQARAEGFDAKALKKLILRRAADRGQAVEEEALVDQYEVALVRARDRQPSSEAA